MKTSFSAYFTPALGEVIKSACTEPYTMSLVGNDRKAVIKAVNLGIDSHPQACFIPARGDKYDARGNRMDCVVSPESLPVLIRRLLDGDDDAVSLASGICETLGIELI